MTPGDVIRATEAALGLPLGAIHSGSRKPGIVRARGLAAVALVSRGLTRTRAAQLLRCDESTVRYQLKKRRESA